MRTYAIAVALLVSAAARPAEAKLGGRDLSGYVGVDSLMPAPKLPAGELTLPDVSTGFTSGQVAINPTVDGEDADYAIDLAPGGNTVGVYGTQLTGCRVSLNGFISCSGVPSGTTYDNRALPDPRWKSGSQVLIAPFWDDLSPVTGTSKVEWWAKSGAMTIVQWTGFALYSNPAARLTFRVTFEQNQAQNRGYVLFQYLQMTGTSADGAKATVGIQSGNGYAANQYAFNTAGAIVTGTAGAGTALQAILFGFDGDGDRLSDAFEVLLGTDPTKVDSDAGGLDDGAELAAGKNPLAMGDDGASTDTDGDGLTDLDEAFYGTDPAKKDTDGDTTATSALSDKDELFTTFTDPLKADTDGDGIRDGAELDAMPPTDPLNPFDPAPLAVNLNVGGQNKGYPQSVTDSAGKVHVSAFSNDSGTPGVFYWMLDASGKILIPETYFKIPSGGTARRTSIHEYNGKIYIVYAILDAPGAAMQYGVLRLNPALAPQDGKPVLAIDILEVSTTVMLPNGVYGQHFDMGVGPSGIHIAYQNKPYRNSFNGPTRGIGYLHLSLDGALIDDRQLISWNVAGHMNKGVGIHFTNEARVAVDSTGVAHVVFHAVSGPHGRQLGGMYYVAIDGSTMTGPYYIGHSAIERSDVDIVGKRLYIATSSGNTSKGILRSSGVRLAILDTQSYTVEPRVGDLFGIRQAINGSSFLLPFTSINPQGPAKTLGASVTALPNGAALVYFDDDNDAVCVLAASPTGEQLAPADCEVSGSNHGRSHKHTNLLASGDFVGFIYQEQRSSSLYYTNVPISRFQIPATFPPINTPPHITSMPPSGKLRALAPYSYAATAVDAETPSANLTWGLDSAPAAMMVSATGTVTWTPALTDVGPSAAQVKACDTGTPVRCGAQSLGIEVVAPGAPIIVSDPSPVAQVGTTYGYQLVVDDPDMNVSGYSIEEPVPLRGDMAITTSGLFTWTPVAADVGTVAISLKVVDSSGLSDVQRFSLTVVPPGSLVRFTSVPSTTALVGLPYAYKAIAVDPADPTAVFTYSLASPPSGNLAMAADGTLTWTPSGDEAGSVAVVIKATSANGRSATQSFTVTVEKVGGGCSCDLGGRTGGMAWAWLLLGGLAVLRSFRRVRSRR
jgi:hypothetical protein